MAFESDRGPNICNHLNEAGDLDIAVWDPFGMEVLTLKACVTSYKTFWENL